MPLPTPDDVRTELIGYCITASIIDDIWIQKKMDGIVIPYVEEKARQSVTGVRTATEYYSGTGEPILILNRRNPIALTRIQLVSGNDIDASVNLASVILITEEGIIKVRSNLSEHQIYRIFPKGNHNIEVQYTYGTEEADCPADLSEAIIMLTAILLLDQLEGRSGGGQLSGQAYNRNYGNMGKYSNIRKRLSAQASTILNRYGSSVVGA